MAFQWAKCSGVRINPSLLVHEASGRGEGHLTDLAVTPPALFLCPLPGFPFSRLKDKKPNTYLTTSLQFPEVPLKQKKPKPNKTHTPQINSPKLPKPSQDMNQGL